MSYATDDMTMELTIPQAGGGSFECPPDDIYTLALTGFSEVTMQPSFDDPNKLRPRFRMDFEIVDYTPDDDDERDWTGTRVSDWFTKSMHENAKLRPFVLALLGLNASDEPEPGTKIQLESLIGGKLRAQVTANAKGYPKISNPMPAKRKKSAASAGVPF